MTNQAYYKDRLGFDPAEILNDAANHDRYRLKNEPIPHIGHLGNHLSNGYEESLCKFKGTLSPLFSNYSSIWGFFIDDKGI